MNTYLVELTCSMYVEAEDEDEAVELARDCVELEDLYVYVDGHDYG